MVWTILGTIANLSLVPTPAKQNQDKQAKNTHHKTQAHAESKNRRAFKIINF
jgi:hypothetical protein